MHARSTLTDNIEEVKQTAGSLNVKVTSPLTVTSAPAVVCTNASATVATVSAQYLAANLSRRYLLIQNNDATGIIYVGFTSASASAIAGIRLRPGEIYEVDNNAPTNSIHIVGSIASNPNVVVVEG